MRFSTYRFLLLAILVLTIVGCGGGGGGGGGGVDNTDTTSPTVNSFTLPATATSLTVPVSGFSASDNVGVIGYLITESATKPAASAAGWSATAPTSFTFSNAGVRTAYAWAKDAAGNVSASRNAFVTITLADTIAPSVTAFTLPATATSLTVPVSGLSASDNIGVVGYLITESATAPSASAAGWSTTPPTSFTFSSFGTKTAYAWAKDAAGHVSTNLMSATVTMHISAAISTAIMPPTAMSTLSISGISDPIICGMELRVTYPVGTTFVSVIASGAAQNSLITEGIVGATETNISIATLQAFASGEIAKINYTSLPSGSVPANFGVNITKVLDCSANIIQ